MSKTKEIMEKLQSGFTAKEIINQGYKHGLVYKIHKQYKNSIPIKPATAMTHLSNITGKNIDNIDNDPEIIQLAKEIRKAELKNRLAEVKAPLEIDPRISTLEKKIQELEENLNFQFDSVIDLQTIVNNPPISQLYRRHQCSCGAHEILSIKVYCPKCGQEYLMSK